MASAYLHTLRYVELDKDDSVHCKDEDKITWVFLSLAKRDVTIQKSCAHTLENFNESEKTNWVKDSGAHHLDGSPLLRR